MSRADEDIWPRAISLPEFSLAGGQLGGERLPVDLVVKADNFR